MNKSISRIVSSVSGIIILVMLIAIVPGKSNAQDINAKISQAIQSSNAADLAKYFNNSIDLTIPGSEGTYSKVQAEQIIKSFFSKYPPVTFTINHKGNSKDGSMYAIGTYKSKSQSFRTYYLTKPIEGQLLIHQLKFESRED
ncbi:MAG: DUF4783 domain-containing protein [Omnitrophica WOR_2 bacterium]|jgi:hypothetical protein